MLSSVFYLAIATVLTSASAQEPEISIDPGSVDIADRAEWCRAQLRSCPSICGGLASPNTCDKDTLEYECVCSDGETPNVAEYEETLPFYLCQQRKPLCLEQAMGDVEAEQECLDVECGSKSPNKQVETETDAESTATETETETETVISTDAAEADELEDDDEDEDEEDNGASMLSSFDTKGWSYFALAMIGFGAFGNEL